MTFSENVTGADAADFALSSGSTGTGSIASLTGSGSQYLVTVSATTDGTYNLDLSPGHEITDTANNPLADTAPTGTDHTYTVSTVPADTTPPTVSSIERHDPTSENTDSQTLVYRVTFSENVTGADATDFALSSGSTGTGGAFGQFTQTRSPAIAITLANTVSDTITVPDSGTATSVSVAIDISHTYIGDLKVDLVAPDDTTRTLHNRSGIGADDIDQTYAPDFGSVSIAGTWTLRINDNYAAADDGVLNSWTLTINHGSTASPVTSISGSGDTYRVTVSATTDGTYNLDLSPGHEITDTANNPLADTAPTGADETYTVSTVPADTTPPTVSSIERHNPAVENTDSQTLVYRVTFSENVTGADAADFALSSGSTGTGSIASLTGSGSQYLVTVSATTDGTYNLDLSPGHEITDTANNPLADTAPTGADHTYTVSTAPADTTPPTVSSIERHDPTSENTGSQTLVYRVTFSENVTGADAADFALSSGSTGTGGAFGQFTQTRSPAIAITLANTVSDTITVPDSGTATSVSVAIDISHTYIGDLKVDLVAPDDTTRTLHNRSGIGADDIDQTYAPDFGSVSIAGTWTLRINDNYAAADDGVLNSWTLTINHGSTASPVTSISGSGDTYRVTVSATTDGTYNLDLSPGHEITDTANNPLADTAPTGTDHTYTVSTTPADTTPPTVSSIERHDPTSENTDSQTLVYRVTFSENVTGADAADFALSSGSTGTGSIASLTGSGSQYLVTVSATTDGTYNLDLSPGHEITDTANNPLADTAPTGADHTYTVSTAPADTTPPTVSSIERHDPTSENTGSQTLVYRVTFSENVTGADAADFALSSGSTGTGSIASLTGSGSQYLVTVSATTDGTYNLDLSPGHEITDTANNPLADTAPTGTDHTYTVSTAPADTTPPTVSSIERHDPTSENTGSQTLVYRVTFSENVTGVDATDFALSSGSTGTGGAFGQFAQTSEPTIPIPDRGTVQDAITAGQSGTATSVSVAVDITHSYIGDLKVDLVAPDGTTRTLHDRTGYEADDIDQTYAPDFGGVGIEGNWILRILDGAGGDTGTLNGWTLTINHDSTAGTANPVTSVSGSGDTYHVTVSASTDGTYNLDLASGHGIVDEASNQLADTTPAGSDHTYIVSTAI